MTTQAWTLLPSGRQLNLLNPHPCAWTDEDLATRLSRTYRWCSDTRWGNPLSVAQHSLTVLHLRQASCPRPLTPAEQLRELLHDAEEGLINHDVPTPLKPLMGEAYQRIHQSLRRCINSRYDLPSWDRADHAAHKQVDRLAAASEAHHVVGWPEADIRGRLGITITPATDDPLPRQAGRQPWEPWPSHVAAGVFRSALDQLQREALGLVGGMRLVKMPPVDIGNREIQALTVGEQPTYVLVEGGGETVEGQIVRGLRDEDGQWDLDGVFTVQTDDGDLVKVHGWNCITEVQ